MALVAYFIFLWQIVYMLHVDESYVLV